MGGGLKDFYRDASDNEAELVKTKLKQSTHITHSQVGKLVGEAYTSDSIDAELIMSDINIIITIEMQDFRAYTYNLEVVLYVPAL